MQIWFVDPKIERFIHLLENATIAKVLRTIDLLEKFGHQLGMPHVKKVAEDLFELRIRGKEEVRLLFVFHNQQVVILHSFLKKSNKIPLKELEIGLRKRNTLDSI